jgi:hypothetical protein
MARFTRRSLLAGLSAMGAAVALWRPSGAAAAQPHMEAALESLRAAERQLKEATADKGGHRGRALRLVHDAIVQVEKGIQFDRRH